jgi:hypothetical protein
MNVEQMLNAFYESSLILLQADSGNMGAGQWERSPS